MTNCFEMTNRDLPIEKCYESTKCDYKMIILNVTIGGIFLAKRQTLKDCRPIFQFAYHASHIFLLRDICHPVSGRKVLCLLRTIITAMGQRVWHRVMYHKMRCTVLFTHEKITIYHRSFRMTSSCLWMKGYAKLLIAKDVQTFHAILWSALCLLMAQHCYVLGHL